MRANKRLETPDSGQIRDRYRMRSFSEPIL